MRTRGSLSAEVADPQRQYGSIAVAAREEIGRQTGRSTKSQLLLLLLPGTGRSRSTGDAVTLQMAAVGLHWPLSRKSPLHVTATRTFRTKPTLAILSDRH